MPGFNPLGVTALGLPFPPPAAVSVSVSGSATAVGDATVTGVLSADVSGSASVAATIYLTVEAAALVAGSATASADADTIHVAYAVVSGSATVAADGYIVPVILADAAVSGSATATGDVDLALFGPVFIQTLRPPVSLNLPARAEGVAADWTTILQVPEYLIPATEAAAEQQVSQRYVVATATAASPGATLADLEFRVVDAQDDPFGFRPRTLLPEFSVPATVFGTLPLTGAVLSRQEVLQVRAKTATPAHVVMGVVASTREVFEVLV